MSDVAIHRNMVDTKKNKPTPLIQESGYHSAK